MTKIYKILLSFMLFILHSCVSSGDVNKALDGAAQSSDSSEQVSTNDVRIELLSGAGQVASKSSNFNEPIRFIVLEKDLPVSNSEVGAYPVTSLGVSLSSNRITTNENGVGELTLISGSQTGEEIIQLSYKGVSKSFSVKIIQVSGLTLSIALGDNQQAQVRETYAQDLVVRVLDNSSIGVSNIDIRFSVDSGNGRIDNTSSTKTVRTNGSGEAKVSFQAGSISGSEIVSAEILGLPLQTVSFNLSALPGVAVLENSILSPENPGLIANGTDLSGITLELKDQYGNKVDASAEAVVFSATRGSFLGSPSISAQGRFIQTYRVPLGVDPSLPIITATVNGVAVNDALTINLLSDSYDLSLGQITSASSQIPANGQSTSLITITLKDSYGNTVNQGGEAVVIQTNNGTLLGSVQDNADGTYSQMLRSSTNAQVATLSATVNAVPLPSTTQVEFVPDGASPARSFLSSAESFLPPDGSSTSLITLVLIDAYGNALTSGAGHVIAFQSSNGVFLGSPADQGNGLFTQVFQAASMQGNVTIGATIDGVALTSSIILPHTSSTSLPSLSFSKVDIIGPKLIAADGVAQTSVRLTLYDKSNQQISDGGESVVFNISEGTLIGSVTDHGDGTYTQNIRSSNNAHKDVVVSAQVVSGTIEDTDQLSFYGSISLSNSELIVAPSAIEANGTSEATIVLYAKDENGVFIPSGGLPIGVTGIEFQSSLGALIASPTDNSNGSYSQIIRSPVSAGQASITASHAGASFSQTRTLDFYTPNNLAGQTIDCSNIASYKNKEILVDNGTLTMNSVSHLADCSSEFVFTTVILRNGGIVTTSFSGEDSTFYGLSLTADNISIDPTSMIDMSSRGNYNRNTNGIWRGPNGQVIDPGYPNLDSAGSHGGQGGHYSSASPLAETYGNILRPFNNGMGGGRRSGSRNGDRGGGKVKLKVNETLKLDGKILANGQDINSSVNNYRLHGAGGSIWVETKRLEGSGEMFARGGNDDGSFPFAAGGGGRIAVYYEESSGAFEYPDQIKNSLKAHGGRALGGSHLNGAAGTVFIKGLNDHTYGDLIINNNGIETTTAKTLLQAPNPISASVITNNQITSAGYFADTYTGKSNFEGYYINPKIDQNVSETFSDDQLFEILFTTNDIATTSPGLTSVNTSPGSDLLQIVLPVDHLHIRGKARVSGNLRVVVMEGDLDSLGDRTMLVEGEVRFPLDSYAVNNTILDNQNFTDALADLPLKKYRSLELRNFPGPLSLNNFYEFDYLTMKDSDINLGMPRTQLSLNINESFSLVNTRLLQHLTSETPGGVEYSIEIAAKNMSIDSSSEITASSKGYRELSTSHCRVIGNQRVSRTSAYIAGTHGGHGGDGSSLGYGSFSNPYWSGGSCRYWSTNTSISSGGGIIRLNVAQTLTHNGVLSADGGYTSNLQAHSGAGGSVYINTGVYEGSGTISAKGGDANDSNDSSHAIGGGGGRIAIHAGSFVGAMNSNAGKLNLTDASGGDGESHNGGAGTVFIKDKDEELGDLIIDNKGKAANFGTHIKTYRGTISSVTSTQADINETATEHGVSSNFLSELWLNPNTGQNGTATYRDDQLFKVTGHNGGELSLSNDPTGTAGINDAYSLVLRAKNLEVSRGAKLFIEGGGAILPEEGDLSSNDLTTMSHNFVSTEGLIDAKGLAYTLHDYGDALESIIGFTQLNLMGGSSKIENTWHLDGDVTFNAHSSISHLERTNLAISGQSSTFILENGSSLTQATTSETVGGAEYSIEVSVQNMSIDSSSEITVSNKGYRELSTSHCRVIGNQRVSRTSAYIAGTHGGHGGDGSSLGYGSFSNPYWSGGSCRYWSSYTSISFGGGIIRLNVAQTLTHNGVLSADGGYTSNLQAHSGAGGSVYINTGVYEGSGTISAKGGGANDSNDSSHAIGGGGGRIAIHAGSFVGAMNSNAGKLNLTDASGGDGESHNGGAGTVFIKDKDEELGDLIINNKGKVANFGTHIKTHGGNLSNISTNSATIDVTGTEHGIESNYLLDMFLNPKTNQNSTPLTSDDNVFRITQQAGGNLTVAGNPSSIAQIGDNYSLYLKVKNLEISNGSKLVLDGQGVIVATEGDLSSSDTVTQNMSGFVIGSSGSIDLNNKSVVMPRFDGELSLIKNAHELRIESGDISVGSTFSSTGKLELIGSTVTANTPKGTRSLDVGGKLLLDGNTSITHAINNNALNQIYAVDIKADEIEITSGSGIDVSAKGHRASANECRVADFVSVPSSTYTPNISYGGNTGYGSLAYPHHAGGACRYNQWYNSYGRSGGIIKIESSKTNDFILDGYLRSNGQNASYSNYHIYSASGGSVLLMAGNLSGSGAIQADGGDATSSNNAVAGAGGRIAVYFTNVTGQFAGEETFISAVSASGGNTNKVGLGYDGGAGTIYRQEYGELGDLILNNHKVDTIQQTTIKLPTGNIAITNNYTLEVGAQQEHGENTQFLKGLYINPNISQNATLTYSDDDVYKILDHQGSTLTLDNSVNVNSVSITNDPFSSVLKLRNLEIRNNAQLKVDGGGRIEVTEGDIISNDTTTMTIPADGITGTGSLDVSSMTSTTLPTSTVEYITDPLATP